MNSKSLLFLIIPFLLLSVACDKVPDERKDDEMARFDAWIMVNNMSSYKTPSGLYYINLREGTGVLPNDSDLVMYSFVVRDLDGNIFSSTYRDTAKQYEYETFKYTTHYTPAIEQYLVNKSRPKGLAEGLGMMRVGGKSRLIMPSSLGYGASGSGAISRYTSLIYDVELIKVFDGDIEGFEQSLIDEYIAKYPTFNLVSDSIYYKTIIGGGTEVKTIQAAKAGSAVKGDSVHINYIGRFLDGFVFDTNIKSVAIDSNIYVSTNKYPELKFMIGDGTMASGFDLAVRQMVTGEKAIIVIPSKYAYGTSGNSDGLTKIPGYTPLVFELQLMKIVPKAVTTER